MSLSPCDQFAPAPPPLPINRRPRFRASIASPSKSPSAHHREGLSPTDIKVEELGPKLKPSLFSNYVEWNKNYIEWRQKMLEVITGEGLLGFIDGTVEAPPKTVIACVHGPKGGDAIHQERENEEYVPWKKLDDWVRNKILDNLSFSMSKRFASLKTANDLWEVIARSEQRIRMRHYLPLYNATIKGDWKAAEAFIEKEPEDAVRARITLDSETALIVATKMIGRKDFVMKLVEKMSPDDLTICDDGGRTALHRAAGFGNIEAAKLLVDKNQDLPNKKTHLQEAPLFYAAQHGDRNMVEWLMGVTAPIVLVGEPGFRILYQLTHSQLYDIALNVLKRYPSVAYLTPNGEEDLKFQALTTLAGTPSSFKSGNNFNCLQELIYSRMKFQIKKNEGMKFPTKKNESMELKNIAENHGRGDIEAPLASNNSGAANGGSAYAVRKKLHAIFSKVIETLLDQILKIKPIQEIREKKLLHNQALDLLKFLCKEAITRSNSLKADRNFRLPLEQAISMGIHEIVEEILRVHPYAVYLKNDMKQSIFQQAILFRQDKVFNLIYQLEESRAIVLSKGDYADNNALHLAGYEAQPEQLYRRAGAALQMQREMQWFKEVERLVLPKNREERNKEGKIPTRVFSDSHKELVREGQQWMKDTASSCTIIASLIATVVFAAAITVPGGNNDNGLPNFDQQTAFISFGIFNALALFSSIASVLLFLSILTSRYAEEDFLVTLPRRLIIGLICLFLSILFTMMAFAAILYLVFGEHKEWVPILAIAFGCLPVTLFLHLQFPLLKDMIKSTCGSGIFDKKSDRISNRLDLKT